MQKNTFQPDRTTLPILGPDYPPCTEPDASKATAPPRFGVTAPQGAPNIVLVLLDDMGFGASSAFGGPICMPTAERLAQNGLCYNNFHTTALCAPTRAAMLTGYNHHSNNLGTISEMGTSFPGNTSIRPKTVTPLARILKENGYRTAQFGKCHETPTWEITPVGSFSHWPTQSGFDKFYGFLGASTNQYAPELYDGVTQIPTPDTPGYHLSEDLADKAIEWVRMQRELASENPFFLYFAPGATHAPHQVPQEYIDRNAGRFDDGWDVVRKRTLENMKAQGIAPLDAKLAAKPADVPDWNSLLPEQKELYAREMEVYAGFAEHIDFQIGRIADVLEEMHIMDDTLFLYILGDNGASAEGMLNGQFNEMTTFNSVAEDFSYLYEKKDMLGSELSYPNYSIGWAIAMNSPFTWAKQVASNYGGTRNGMLVHYPTRIKAKNEIRSQFHHCVDIAPTILEMAGVPHPTLVDGVHQRSVEGVSMAYTFSSANVATRRSTQYFCAGANYGIYHDGWFAGVVSKIPWIKIPIYSSYEDGVWELYNVEKDFAMAKDLALAHPEKLEEMKALFMEEAVRYNVLPIDSRGHLLFDAKFAGRPDLSVNKKEISLTRSGIGLRENCFPNMKNTSFCITADIEVEESSNGVLISQGGRFAGWSLYVKDTKPCFVYNYFGMQYTYIRSDAPLQVGTNQIVVQFTYVGGGIGGDGMCSLCVNGKEQAQCKIEKTVPLLFSFDEITCVGEEWGTPVSEEYTCADSYFTGNIYGIQIIVNG